MKKITFKVNTKKEGSVVSLIKEVIKISYRIQIDLEKGFIAVENVDDTMIDSIIELVDQYYTILSVNIDNISDEPTLVETPKSVIVDDTKSMVTVKQKNNSTALSPQTEDDLIIQKIEFKNEYIEDLLNKLIKTLYWAMYKFNVPEREIGDFIFNTISEISMRYNRQEPINFSIGDIVDCNYGIHLPGEINGGHVTSIVCDITNHGMVYLVPITKVKENLTSRSYLTFDAPNDIVYYKTYYSGYSGGTALLDKGRYLRNKRLREVIGKATPKFLANILNKLNTTFDFRKNIVMTDNTEVVKTTSDDDTESSFVDADKSNVTTTTKKAGIQESILLDIIGESLNKLDPAKKVEEQVYNFLTDIGMTTSERIVTQSFVVACDIDKLIYENVIFKLHNMFPKVKEDTIKLILNENFKEWFNLYPELLERCPKISPMAVLKVFAKRFE